MRGTSSGATTSAGADRERFAPDRALRRASSASPALASSNSAFSSAAITVALHNLGKRANTFGKATRKASDAASIDDDAFDL